MSETGDGGPVDREAGPYEISEQQIRDLADTFDSTFDCAIALIVRDKEIDRLRAQVAAERERCAKVCRDKATEWLNRADAGDMSRDTARHANIAAGQIEAAILKPNAK